jgi:PAS domain-containing protein
MKKINRHSDELILQEMLDWEDSFDTMVTIHDKDFNIVKANKSAEKIIELPFSQISKEKCSINYHGSDQPPEGCPGCECLKTGKPSSVEIFEPHLNKFLNIKAIPRFDDNGKIKGLIHVVKDITEHRKAEDQLKKAIKKSEDEKTKTSAILDAIGDLISIQGKDFKVIYQNKRHRDLVGDRTGEYCYRAYQGKDHVCEGCHLAMSFEDGKIHTVERSRNTDEGIVHSLNTASLLRDSAGEIIAGIEIVRDITKRKIAEESLQKAHDKLENRVNERTIELKESNTALKVLLKQREKDQNEFENNILSNIKHLIYPYISKLRKNRAMSEELVYLNVLESNLKEIVSPFSSKLSCQYMDLTPKEILVANLIKEGKQDKDIMEILNVSLETVKSHRQNIRKKLGIYGKRTNLRTKLLSLTE